MMIQVITTDLPPWKVASLQGRIDAFNDKRVMNVLRQMIESHAHFLAVDLAKVDFIGFYALQEILKIAEELKARAGELVVVGPTAQVRRHLDSFTGHKGLRIFRDLEELSQGLVLMPKAEHAARELSALT